MQLQTCESPKYYVNPYTGEEGYSGCGKCIACKSKKNNHWVQRLERERRCWRYCIFFTLTYSDSYLPRLTLLPSGHLVDLGRRIRLLTTRGDLRVDYEYSGEMIDAKDIELLNLSDNDYEYLHRRQQFDYIPVTDIQRFIKRFRYYAQKFAEKKNESSLVRYFISSEVGPTTLRSHIHGLLYFSSEAVYQHFDEIINSSWKMQDTNIDWKAVTSSASAYTASYCNSILGLPQFYQLRPLRPFVLCSRHPAIGTIDPPNEEIDFDQIIHHSVTTFNVPDYKSHGFVSVPLWREFQDRYFPKCTGFSRISHSDRVKLYGISFTRPWETWKEFKQRWYFNLDNDYILPSVRALVESVCRITEHDPNYNCLKRLFYVSKKVHTLCSLFGSHCGLYPVSLDRYVRYIENFYTALDYNRLKDYFLCQDTYSVQYGLSSWISCDSLFLRKLSQYRTTCKSFPEWVNLTLQSFNINPLKLFNDTDYFNQVTYSKSVSDYFKNLHIKYSESHKVKEKKEYLMKHPELSYLVYNNSEKFIYHGY